MTNPDFAHSTLGFSTAQHVASGQRMVRPTSVKLDYFGKLPSRGAFVPTSGPWFEVVPLDQAVPPPSK